MIDPPSHSGLLLERTVVGLGEHQEHEISERWRFEAITDYIYKVLGLPIPVEPTNPYPNLTIEDLTTTDGKRYSTVYLHQIEWSSWVGKKKGEVEARLVLVDAEMKEISRGIRVNMRKHCTRKNAKGQPKPPTGQEMEDEIGEDPRYKELSREQAFLAALLKMMNSEATAQDAKAGLISRQVEIRRQEFDNNNRSGSIQGRRGIPNAEREPRSRF
jgi:hypothetical protein